MSIDFSKVTAITTPSGSLSNIKRTSDSVQLWPYVQSKDTIILNGSNFVYDSSRPPVYKYIDPTQADLYRTNVTTFTYIKPYINNTTVTVPLTNPIVGSYTIYLLFFGTTTQGSGVEYGNFSLSYAKFDITSTEQTNVTLTFNTNQYAEYTGVKGLGLDGTYIPGFMINLNDDNLKSMIDLDEFVKSFNIILKFSNTK